MNHTSTASADWRAAYRTACTGGATSRDKAVPATIHETPVLVWHQEPPPPRYALANDRPSYVLAIRQDGEPWTVWAENARRNSQGQLRPLTCAIV